MEAAMPCKMGTKKRSSKPRVTDDETKGSNKIHKTVRPCIVEAQESTRKRLEPTPPKDHEDHIAEKKGYDSVRHHNLVHKFTTMPQAMNSGCEGRGVQGKEKARNMASMAIGQDEQRKGGYSGSTKRQKEIHSASLMDICHSKIVELEPKFQKYIGRFRLRGDIVKDDSGADAVFTEQGSSASQMAAAKVMGVIARLPDCAGKAADALSTYTQVKMEDAPIIVNIPVRMSRCWDTSSTKQVAKASIKH